MFRHTPYALRAALFAFLLFGSVSAFAQKLPLQGVPSVNLGLPRITTGDPVKLPTVGVSATVPSIGGLTPPLNATVSVGGSVPGVPPLPETPQGQLAETRLELLPTCR